MNGIGREQSCSTVSAIVVSVIYTRPRILLRAPAARLIMSGVGGRRSSGLRRPPGALDRDTADRFVGCTTAKLTSRRRLRQPFR